MFNMKSSDFKVIGESLDTPDFFEVSIKCPSELNPECLGLYHGNLIMGYDREGQVLHLVEFFDEGSEQYQEYIIEEYLDANGVRSAVFDFKFVEETSVDERSSMKIIIDFIEKTENDKETFDFLERAVIDYLI